MLIIKNGTVFTMEEQGILKKADILVDQGKIVKIADSIDIPNADIVDAAGYNVLPGIVDAHSHIGGFDTDTMADDLNELTNSVTPELESLYGINPDSSSFINAYKNGITTSCIAPGSGNVICGLVCAVKSAGNSFEERVIKNPVALKAAMGVNPKGVYGPRLQSPMSRMGLAETFREFFKKVQDYQKKKAKSAEDGSEFKIDQGMEHGLLVLEKKIPLKVHSYQHDMMTMLDIAKEFDFYVTLDHALGASDFYDELEEAKDRCAVIYGPIGCPVFAGELCKIDIGCLKELDRRGVTCAIMTDGPVFEPWMIIAQAGEVVREGADSERVLRMITINAAKIMGLENKIGSIKEGKDADFVLFRGIPALDTDAEAVMTIINGKIVYQA